MSLKGSHLFKLKRLQESLCMCFVRLYRDSDISRGRGPAKFRYFREIPRNSPKNAKYREIRQKYFQIHVGKTYLILILAIRPVLFMNVAKNWVLTIMLVALAFAHFSSELLWKEQMIIPVKKTLKNAGHIHAKLIDFS